MESNWSAAIPRLGEFRFWRNIWIIFNSPPLSPSTGSLYDSSSRAAHPPVSPKAKQIDDETPLLPIYVPNYRYLFLNLLLSF
jgi:hypothetical protein